MLITYGAGQLSIDLKRIQVFSDGKPVALTKQEWAILRVLVSYTGLVVTQRQLLRGAWGPQYSDASDYVRTYIRRLRSKLEPDPHDPRYILLERGAGYRMATADNALTAELSPVLSRPKPPHET